MKRRKTMFGNSSDTKLNEAAATTHISGRPVTLADLLDAIPPEKIIAVPMLRTAAAHICDHLGLSSDQITIDNVAQAIPSFRVYLKARRFSCNSVRTYCNLACALVRHAHSLGWVALSDEVQQAWQPVISSIRYLQVSVGPISSFAIRNRKSPQQFTDSDLDAWVEEHVKNGGCYSTAQRTQASFRLAVFKHVRDVFPLLTLPNRQRSQYGVRLSEIPEPLSAEIAALLSWKQQPYSPGRPRHARIREVSAKRTEGTISRLYGFAKSILRRNTIQTLPELVSEEVVVPFVTWCLNERRISGVAMVSLLGPLCTAMCQFPAYKSFTFDWFRELVNSIPLGDDSQRLERKLKRYLSYDALQAAVFKIREERKHVYPTHDKRSLART